MDSDGITFAHVGDSRIYYLRQGEILYRSEDHSLVNLWVSLGKITPEEAATHPQRNVIVRAIEGSHSSTEADVNRWTDVRAGDFVFLCTDGLLEQWSDKEIAEEGLSRMENWMKELGLTMRLGELGVTADMLPAVAQSTLVMQGGYKVLNRADILAVLKASL